jgi:hypothetical protein
MPGQSQPTMQLATCGAAWPLQGHSVLPSTSGPTVRYARTSNPALPCHCRLTTVTHTLPSHSRQPTQMLPQLHQRELPACRARQRQELCSGRQLL